MAERNSRTTRPRRRAGGSRGASGAPEAGTEAARGDATGESSVGRDTDDAAQRAGRQARTEPEAGAEPIVVAERITVIAETPLPPEGAGAARGASALGDGSPITAEQRYLMIAERAYERARERGFAPGGELEDWLIAEQEVDARLAGGG